MVDLAIGRILEALAGDAPSTAHHRGERPADPAIFDRTAGAAGVSPD